MNPDIYDIPIYRNPIWEEDSLSPYTYSTKHMSKEDYLFMKLEEAHNKLDNAEGYFIEEAVQRVNDLYIKAKKAGRLPTKDEIISTIEGNIITFDTKKSYLEL